MTTIDRRKLTKQPWREMASWLKNQKDFQTTKIFTTGFYLKNRFTLDFYLLPSKKSDHISLFKPKEEKVYLVETNSAWKLKDELLKEVFLFYDVKIIDFQKGNPEFGRVYVCTMKRHLFSH